MGDKKYYSIPLPSIAGIETSTIGRTSELEQLQAAFQTAQHGAQVVTIVGEAGIGKTRLLNEFARWLDQQPGPLKVFQARATGDGASRPYALIRDTFVRELGIGPNDSPAVERQKLEQGLLPLLGSHNAHQIPFIGYVLGFDYSASRYLHGILHDARQIRERAFHYMAQVFTHMLQERPLVVLLEGLHWADYASLDFVDHMVRQNSNLPLLVVALALPQLYEWRPAWGKSEHLYSRLDLQPLSHAQTLDLIGEILSQAPDIPLDVHQQVAAHAGGSPLYVEQVVHFLIDQGVIQVGSRPWQVDLDRLAQVGIPPSLADVMLTRLEGLSPQERAVLERAAVVGHVFWDELVGALHDQTGASPAFDPALLGSLLDQLEAKDWIVRHIGSAFPDTLEYAFKHTPLREVFYRSVPDALCQQVHAQAARWLAARADQVGEFSARIGEHYALAADFPSALDWYVRAGEQAKSTYAPEMAAGLFRRALDLWAAHPHLAVADPTQPIRVLGALGDMLDWQGRFAEAVGVFEQMRDLARQSGSLAAEARAWRGIAAAYMYQGNILAALENATQAGELARQADAGAELAMSLQLQALARFRGGEPVVALKLGEEAVGIARHSGSQLEVANGLNLLGGIHFFLGHYAAAADYQAEALQIFQDLGNRGKALDIQNNLGAIAEALGDYEVALEHYQDAVQTAREIGRRNKEIQFLANLGGVRVKLCDYASAESDLLRAIALAGDAGMGKLAEPYRYLSSAYLGQDRLEEALQAARHALALGRQFKALDDVAGAWRVLGMIAARTLSPVSVVDDTGAPQAVDAPACFDLSVQIYEKLGMRGEQAATLCAWARYELRHGSQSRGAAMWSQAHDIYHALGAELEAARMSDDPPAVSQP